MGIQFFCTFEVYFVHYTPCAPNHFIEDDVNFLCDGLFDDVLNHDLCKNLNRNLDTRLAQ